MYLVTWTGLTSGSFMGRDDGYPETKMAIVSPKDMYRYMSHRDVKVFTISQINAKDVFNVSMQAEKDRVKRHQDAIQTAKNKLTPNEQRLLGVK